MQRCYLEKNYELLSRLIKKKEEGLPWWRSG